MVEECSKQGVRAAVGLEGLEKASEDVSIANCYNFPFSVLQKMGCLNLLNLIYGHQKWEVGYFYIKPLSTTFVQVLSATCLKGHFTPA
jgi:hypothetical protein